MGLFGLLFLCSGCMDLFDHHFVLSLHRPIRLPFRAQNTLTYMITILCSSCMDLYGCQFVLRSQTYMISIMICILYSSHMDLFYICELTAQRDFGFWQLFIPFCAQTTWTYMIAILCSGPMDLYDHHFVLRLYTSIWSAFCAQVTQTYYTYSSLKYYNAARCHPHLPFIPTMYTCTVL